MRQFVLGRLGYSLVSLLLLSLTSLLFAGFAYTVPYEEITLQTE